MLEDDNFKKRLVDDAMANVVAIRHAAGLKRNDADLLQAVSNSVRSVFETAAEGFEAKMFDLIKSKPGWSKEDPDLELLSRRLDMPVPEPPQEEEVDERVDEYHDSLDFYDESSRDQAEVHPVDTVWMAAGFLANVLRNSELVDDIVLKTEVLKTIIDEWSVFTVMAAVREDQEAFLRDSVMEWAEELAVGETVDLDAVARFIELILVFITVLAAQMSLGTIHLEGTVTRLIDDEEFMASSAHALLVTMLYAAIGAPNWPDRMSDLYEKHRDHPVVAELVRTYALAMYRLGGLPENDTTKLESFLADTYAGVPESLPGPARTLARNENRSRVLQELRRARRRVERRQGPASGLDDLLEDQAE
jgi:hypothetical protein